ncbi:hypothetical protein B0O99DRAFT_500720 [Bisporella sp. PMI_857]|nr:hypothetical protein B0O99DRAFT_500720 [Bisporella sp. PMI_857]
MQKVTAILPSWDKTKTSSKAGFDKGWKLLDKIGTPVNRLSNKVGSEAFWPTSLDKESDKAARILKSFCKDGFYTEEDRPTSLEGPSPKTKQRVLKKIPEKVIQDAVGLAIFTTMRTGLWISGAGGSGVLIARKEDGSWSPPSGIMLHTAGLGFLVGVDIYDCVVVINNRKALDAFTKIRATLGGEISAVAGPVGIGGVLENDGKWKQANRPVFTYLKSRGFYAGVQVDGTVIIERTDENERFYGERIGVADILAGKARHPPYSIKLLMETVKAAEGNSNVDQGMLQSLDDMPAPADNELSTPTIDTPVFGVPEPDDPDPFGVLALQKAGLEIREAGTGERPLSSQFDFNPSPTSPVYGKFHRLSMDTLATRSGRESYLSTRSIRTRASMDRGTQTDTAEMGTQTDEVITPITSPTHSSFDHTKISEENEKQVVPEPEEVDYTKIDLGPYTGWNNNSQDFDGTTAVSESPRENDIESHSEDKDTSYLTEDDLDDEEEPVVFEVASSQATVLTPQVIKAHGGLVNIPKRPPPPPLPPRNSARSSKIMIDQASGKSPTKGGFEEVDVHGVERKSEDSKRSHQLEQASSMVDIEKNTPRSESLKGLGISMPRIDSPMEEAMPKTDDEPAKKANEDVKPVITFKPDVEEETFHSLPETHIETLQAK